MSEPTTAPPIWTEGVCGDGVAILCEGVMVPIEGILTALNHREALRASFKRLPLQVEYRLPTHSQCEEKVKSGEATELEKFIYEYEIAGPDDAEWRAALAAVMSEAVEEDRWSCMPEVTP